MAEIITNSIIWKTGETGKQYIVLYESDGITRRNGIGKTYTLKFWLRGATNLYGSGSLTAVDASQGEYYYSVTSGNTVSAGDFEAEIAETTGSDILKTNTFEIQIVSGAPA